MSGCADMFTSRRTCYNICYYWNVEQDNNIVNREEIVRKRNPSGHFYAKEESDENDSLNVVNGSIMFERKNISLKTYDDIQGLKRGDFVSYEENIWMVDFIGRKKVRRQSMYGNYTPYIYIINLRR